MFLVVTKRKLKEIRAMHALEQDGEQDPAQRRSERGRAKSESGCWS